MSYPKPFYVLVFCLLLSNMITGCGGSSDSGQPTNESGNDESLELMVCDDGFVLNEDTQACVVDTSCEFDAFVWSEEYGECRWSCSDDEAWNLDLGRCVPAVHFCEYGTKYPLGFSPDENSTQEDCVFAGPEPTYYPWFDEVVLYLNRQHVDANYEDYNFYRWNGCWSEYDGSWPGKPMSPDGIDPVYGAFYVFRLDSTCDDGDAHFIINTSVVSSNQTDDLVFDIESQDPYARMIWIITGPGGELNTEAGAIYSVDSGPICLPASETNGEFCGVVE